METYYLIIVAVLFILAISDLIFGVANDAVNFLNSGIGSKVAPRHIVLIVASLGVLGGALFSSGMMEVARKGLFHPEMFTFAQIMGLFVAVMFTDVLLLDLYNTFGLPTSTWHRDIQCAFYNRWDRKSYNLYKLRPCFCDHKRNFSFSRGLFYRGGYGSVYCKDDFHIRL